MKELFQIFVNVKSEISKKIIRILKNQDIMDEKYSRPS